VPRQPKYRGHRGQRIIAIAACVFLSAGEGTKAKAEALARMKRAMDQYGPFPKKLGAPKGSRKLRPNESIEVKQARKRIKEQKKMRLRRAPFDGLKKGPEWVAWKKKIAAQVRAEAAAKLEQQLGDL